MAACRIKGLAVCCMKTLAVCSIKGVRVAQRNMYVLRTNPTGSFDRITNKGSMLIEEAFTHPLLHTFDVNAGLFSRRFEESVLASKRKLRKEKHVMMCTAGVRFRNLHATKLFVIH